MTRLLENVDLRRVDRHPEFCRYSDLSVDQTHTLKPEELSFSAIPQFCLSGFLRDFKEVLDDVMRCDSGSVWVDSEPSPPTLHGPGLGGLIQKRKDRFPHARRVVDAKLTVLVDWLGLGWFEWKGHQEEIGCPAPAR